MTHPHKRKVYRRTRTGFILYGVGPVPFKQCSRCPEKRERGSNLCAACRRGAQNARGTEMRRNSAKGLDTRSAP